LQLKSTQVHFTIVEVCYVGGMFYVAPCRPIAIAGDQWNYGYISFATNVINVAIDSARFRFQNRELDSEED